MAEKLQGPARAKALSDLNGWSEVDGRDAISKTFTFQELQ
jgi:4a-hydroxytetrahydrobiopterin dehydratase